ncbi:hypothetical protein DL768_005576 [Monosporascus sp. mg162]|nr:hypothetical protein DL768_005576 [Monosporascus sp. mg162]
MNSLYELKQAGAAWQKKVRTILVEYDFKPLTSDDAIYINPKTRDIITSHVDNFLLFSPDTGRLRYIADAIASNVPINDLGAIDWYLGVRIIRSSETGDVRLDQEQYIDRALANLGIDNMRSEPTPFIKEHLNHATRFEGAAAIKATGVRIFLEELGLMPEGPITILEDNNGTKKKSRKAE